jgi:murein DD-endopeptidase MepM/ murein hydrolase activator NlpD
MKKRYHFMVIPESREPALNFQLSSGLLKVLLVIIAIWFLVLIVLTIFYGKLIHKAWQADVLHEENERLRDYNSRVVEIEKSFKKNRELTAKIASMAGIDLEVVDNPLTAIPDSLFTDVAGRGVVTGVPGDRTTFSTEELENLRVPKGRPLYGWITRGFISGDNKEKHEGVDIAVKEGTPVVATATGVVVFFGWDKDYGNLIIIDHGNGYKTVYGHNNKVVTTKGEKVYKGDVIALSGNTGHSTAPHLHYGILKDGEPIDPSPFLD